MRRIASFVEGIETKEFDRLKSVRLNPGKMYSIANAGSVSRLARVVQILLDAKIFERQLLVKSPSGGEMVFYSYADLPEIIREPGRDVDFEVAETNVEIAYVPVLNGGQ